MDLHERADRLASLMEERLDIMGQGLAVKYHRSGRRLPRWVKREIAALLDALNRVDHPRLRAQIDFARIDSGTQRAEAWLSSIDPWDRRKGIVIHWLAGNAMNLILVIGLVIALMAWRGLL